MVMNSRLRIIMKTKDYERIREEAMQAQLSVSAFCRTRILKFTDFSELKNMIERIIKNEEKLTTALTLRN